MFVAALIGAAVDQRSTSWKGIKQRLRLSAPSATAWLWAAALAGFMYGGNWADLLAVAASWLALWKEKTGQKWMFGAILIGILVKRYASLFQPTLESIRFFDPSAFHREFFNHFGPKDFMGIPLQGAWWIPNLLCCPNTRVQYRRGRALVARLCPATPRAGVRKDRMGCSWHFLVNLPSVHATHSLGHHPHGNHRCGAFLCCTTHKEHMAGHRRPQFRQSDLLSELG